MSRYAICWHDGGRHRHRPGPKGAGYGCPVDPVSHSARPSPGSTSLVLTAAERRALGCHCAAHELSNSHHQIMHSWIVDVEDIVREREREAAERAWDEWGKAIPQYLGPDNGHYPADCMGWEDCHCASYPNPYRRGTQEGARPMSAERPPVPSDPDAADTKWSPVDAIDDDLFNAALRNMAAAIARAEAAEAEVAVLRARVEAEWFNGNIAEDVRDRILRADLGGEHA